MNTVCQKTLDEILKVIDKRIEEHTSELQSL
jgi:hypothetical protein